MRNLNLNPGSLLKLEECDQRIQLVFRTVAQTESFLVVCGFRNQADQDRAYSEGKSHIKWPEGKHNRYPSHAIDIAPIPLDYSDVDAFYRLGAIVMKTAASLNVPLRWGATFSKLKDLGHYELIDSVEESKNDDKIKDKGDEKNGEISTS